MIARADLQRVVGEGRVRGLADRDYSPPCGEVELRVEADRVRFDDASVTIWRNRYADAMSAGSRT